MDFRNFTTTEEANEEKHNHKYFNKIDTEAKAYILGYTIADGCVYIGNSKRLCFMNSMEDISTIELIRNEISPTTIIYSRHNNKGALVRKEQSSLRIASNELCEVLINKYNIRPNKTKHDTFEFDFNLIEGKLVHHFIRGYFDGDGSVSFHLKDKRICFDFSYVCNSLLFTKQIACIFETLFKIRAVIYEKEGKTCKYYLLRFDYSRNRTVIIEQIYKWLYDDATYFLERKKQKFINYFEYRAN